MVKFLQTVLMIYTMLHMRVVVADYKDNTKAKDKQRTAELFYIKLSTLEGAFLEPLCGAGDAVKFCQKILTTSYFYDDRNSLRLEENLIPKTCHSKKLTFMENAVTDVVLADVLLACPYVKGAKPSVLNPMGLPVKEVVYAVKWRIQFEDDVAKGILLFKDVPIGILNKVKGAVTSGVKNMWPQRSAGAKDKAFERNPSTKGPSGDKVGGATHGHLTFERGQSIKQQGGNNELGHVMLVTGYRHRKK